MVESKGHPAADASETLIQQEYKKATEKAMNLLLQKDRTKKELEDRLFRAGFSEQATQYAMRYVMEFGYINDSRYAADYIDLHKRNRSRLELQIKLMKKGVDSEVIAQAFESYEAEDEEEAIRTMLQKRLRGKRLSDMEYADRNKVTAYLARKGYALPVVKRIMRELF